MADMTPSTGPITALRAWVAARALGVSRDAILPALIPDGAKGIRGSGDAPAGEWKANPVGQLAAQMWNPGSVIYTPISYEALAREGVLRNGYIYRAITIIARACAGIPWVLYRDSLAPGADATGGASGATGGGRTRRGGAATGGKLTTVALDDHPLLDVLRRPHGADEIFGTASLIEQLISYYILSGNTYLTAVGPGRVDDAGGAVALGSPTPPPTTGGTGSPAPRNGKTLPPPQEVWVLRPDRMRVIPAETGGVGVFRYIAGGKQRDFGPTEVLHWKAWNPSDDWYGLSPVAVAARIVDQMNAANDWNTALLQNMAKPSGFLTAPGQLPDTVYERLRLELREKWGSAKNAGRPQVLEGGLTWQQIGLTPADMDWLAGKIANVRELSVILGVPSEMLGDSTNKTYANYDAARKSFYAETILPLMDVLRDLLNAWLVPMWGDARLRLDYDRDDIEALQEDRALVWSRAKDAYGGGLLTLNEARDLLGYDATPDGDVFIAPPRAMTLDQLLAGADFPKPPAPGGIPNTPPHNPPADAPTPPAPAPDDSANGSGGGGTQPTDGSAADAGAQDGAHLTGDGAKALSGPVVDAASYSVYMLDAPTGRMARVLPPSDAHLKQRDARDKWIAVLTREAQAQFTAEERALTSILTDTALTPTEQLARVQAQIASEQAAWHKLLVAAYLTIGVAAGKALYDHWRADGLIPTAAQYSGITQGAQDAQSAQLDARATDITAYTADRVTATLAQARSTLAEDVTHAAAAAALTTALHALYDEWTGRDTAPGGSRSDVIGATEAGAAWGAGMQDAVGGATDTAQAAASLAQSGQQLQAVKTWNAVMDIRTRPEHADADGQTVAVGANFSVGGEDLMYPCDGSGSPGNTIGCRCWVTWDLAVVDASAAADDGTVDE